MMRMRFFSVILGSLACFFANVVHSERLPVEAFASLPDATGFELSPSGNQLLFLSRYATQDQQGTMVNIVDVDSFEMYTLVTSDNKKYKIRWVTWAGEDKVLISALYPSKIDGIPVTETRLLVKNLKSGKMKNVLPSSFYRGLRYAPQYQDNVIDPLPEEPNAILLSIAREGVGADRVYKVDLEKQKYKTVQAVKRNIENWMTDRQHRVRVGFYRDDTDFRIYYKSLKDAKWRERWRFDAFSDKQVWPLGFDLDPNTLYVSAYHDGRKAIFKTNLEHEKPELTLVYADDTYDVDGQLIYSDKTGELIGTTYSKGGGYLFWHPNYAALQRGINKALPDTNNYIVSLSKDETRYVVVATNEKDAGTYYLGDRTAKSLSPLVSRYSALDPNLMAESKHFIYSARDGLKIEAFLTRPKGVDTSKPLPTIVFPHGGPISYDSKGFDYWVQFFANRGYAVLQMNFRGSSGYGYDFMKAGLKNWGQAMQDDVEDGIRSLIDKGIANKDQICIAGASYGGYAALMGAVKTPELYRCVISFAGVTDLPYMRKKARYYTNEETFEEQIGSDMKLLRENSPVTYAKKIQVPVLLIHGDDDRSVRVEHSRKMHKALTSAGKNSEYLEFEDGDHHLSLEAFRVATFKAMDKFLAKHLPVKH